ncbi:Detected protein of unknown function [Hibiscus syriacus]|uniref:Cytochrome P450 n=1 Tax=Hibiscus syriacus TaxID=106335 RepID=A0A6A2XK70_HIBSY|nr:Detected protein of unknown function [Hibiscus syriacus]
MTELMVESDIRVDDCVRSFTSYVISKVVFGDEWQKGMEIFPKSLALINAMSSPTILSGIPFFRYLPTKNNREIWRIEKEIHSIIMGIVKKHAESETACKDLLQVVIEGSKGNLEPSITADQFIADNCKDICIPASETRIRAEVSQVCENGVLNFDMLHKMKMQQHLFQGRPAKSEAGACKSCQAYIPFGLGARECPGQSFAMTELQVLFAIIVSNFILTIAPSYRYSPQYALLTEPEFGVNLLVRKI